jgi:hypothetical protein
VVDPNRALFECVVRLLGPVLDDLVFVGGCTTGLFLTDPGAGGTRSTKDDNHANPALAKAAKPRSREEFQDSFNRSDQAATESLSSGEIKSLKELVDQDGVSDGDRTRNHRSHSPVLYH